MTIDEFGKTIKQKYPQYQDIDDSELGQKMIEKYPQYNDMVLGQKETKQPVVNAYLEGHPILKGISDTLGMTGLAKGASQAIFFNFTPEGKNLLQLRDSGQISQEEVDRVVGGIATPKEVVGGAVGLGTSIAGGLKKGATALGRMALGSTVGAGFGLSQGLQQSQEAPELLSSTAKGAGVGLLVSGAFEGIGQALKQISQSKAIQRRTGFTYNKELQPPVKDVSKDIEKGFKTFGEQVAGVKDATGNPVYVGTYRTMLNKAKGELSEKGNALNKALVAWDKANPKVTIRRDEVAKGIGKIMEDSYGRLSPAEVKKIAFEVARMPKLMSLEQVEKIKRMYDGLIPDSFWSKIDDPAQSFPSLVKYALRDSARKIINDKTADGVIQGLNNNMGIAMDVKKLAASQIAKRSLAKVSEAGGTATTRFPFSYYLSKLFDDVLLNPALTTRTSQAVRNMGTKTGQTIPRQIGRTELTKGLQ